jgi:hypothetical protein
MEHKKLYNLKFMARSADPAPAAFQSEQWTLEGLLDLPDPPADDKGEAEVTPSRMSFGHFNPTFETQRKKRGKSGDGAVKKVKKTG